MRSGVSRRTLVLSGAAAAVLAALSTVGVAVASGQFGSARCAAPRLPGTVVAVAEFDMGKMSMPMMRGLSGRMRLVAAPTVVPAGVVSFLVHNRGMRTHELVVLPLPSGSPAGARAIGANGRVAEDGSPGEASRTCGGGEGEGIRAGSTGWATLHLSAGRYELVCNLKNHYRSGMYAELDVT